LSTTLENQRLLKTLISSSISD